MSRPDLAGKPCRGLKLKEKVTYHQDPKRVVYDDQHWRLLEKLRAESLELQQRLPCSSVVYGSVARGDVHPGSDIDILIFQDIPSYRLELALDGDYLSREIVQATPNALMKAHIHLSENVTVTFPLAPMTDLEMDFYRFSGCVETGELARGSRVPGVSKRLVLVEPEEDGHRERSLLDDPHGCTRLLGVSPAIIEERVRVLTRRDKVGRTGVFLRATLREEESFEQRLKAIADGNNVVRRMLKQRGVI